MRYATIKQIAYIERLAREAGFESGEAAKMDWGLNPGAVMSMRDASDVITHLKNKIENGKG